MTSLIEPGRCSACLAPAERGPSGAWRHDGVEPCVREDAWFEAVRQPRSPRDRQIRDPGRNR